MSHKGYFIDWNGQIRSTDDPGHGYCCEVDSVARRVTVISKRGATMQETELYRSLTAVEQAGIQTELVSGSFPWAHLAVGHSRERRPRLPPLPSRVAKALASQRTSLWLHQLRDRCTEGARNVYALLQPAAQKTYHSDPATLLEDLAQHVAGIIPQVPRARVEPRRIEPETLAPATSSAS
jgi:hypothetical protein